MIVLDTPSNVGPPGLAPRPMNTNNMNTNTVGAIPPRGGPPLSISTAINQQVLVISTFAFPASVVRSYHFLYINTCVMFYFVCYLYNLCQIHVD